ncbi:MAG: DUF4175 family protein [Rubellimicrobium sp.]|nr:DUF4175 family protein [Rubellimicrobium sp.]
MVAERLWHAFWPLGAIALVLAAPRISGVDTALPDSARALWFWSGGAALVLALALGLRRLRWPRLSEARARVDARLPGRPLAALADRQAMGSADPGSRALWQAHLGRMRALSHGAAPVPPTLEAAARDPMGLRLMALLIFSVAVIFAQPGAAPGGPTAGTAHPGATTTGPAWEGWIEPPAHTGQPTLYLADLARGPVEVPEGARVTIRLYGNEGAHRIEQTVADPDADPAPGTPPEAPPGTPPGTTLAGESFAVARSGRIAITGAGGREWQVIALPDLPPAVTGIGPVEVDAAGVLAQPFTARDDYGITGGTATFTLDPARIDRRHGLAPEPMPRSPITVDLPLPHAGDRREIAARLVGDFSLHPWANLPVQVVYRVSDAPEQSGASAPEPMILPGRRFFQPVARALIELRRDLLWSHENTGRVLELLSATAHRPEGLFPSEAALLRLRALISDLAAIDARGTMTSAEEEAIAQGLWDLALTFEEGRLADARERLARAQERLSEAMRTGATAAEIADLMAELRAATDDYLDLLAEDAAPAPDMTDQPGNAQDDRREVSQDQIREVMDRIQNLMEEGRMDEAAALMRQLDELLQNLEMQQGGAAGEGRPGPADPRMRDLEETLRDQQDLSDDAFRDLQDRFNGRPAQGDRPPGKPLPGDDPAQTGTDEAAGDEGQDLVQRQEELRRALESQQAQLPGLTGEAADRARGALDEAGRAMDRAADALARDDLAQAIDEQAQALSALREGLRELNRALAENARDPLAGDPAMQDGTPDGTGTRPVPGRRDPLGRQAGDGGLTGSDRDVREGPDADSRARELLEELRRRAGERGRDPMELDYLERLLERF